jgi:carbamoyltransferase
MLLFGDSQTAGLGVSNRQRYGDLIEKSLPGLEVFNFAVDGFGTDQEYLAYVEHRRIAHDLVVIGLFVEDIGRVSTPFFARSDSLGKKSFYAKPYYELRDHVLSLNHVPVPREVWTEQTLPQNRRTIAARPAGLVTQALDKVRRIVPNPPIRRALMGSRLGVLIQRTRKVQRAPDYDSPDNAGWRLLSEILKKWIAESRTPVLLVPIPMRAFVYGESDPSGYQSRCRELAAETKCALHDPLPDLLTYAASDRHRFFFTQDAHLSPQGHQALAQSIQPAIARLMLSSPNTSSSTSP